MRATWRLGETAIDDVTNGIRLQPKAEAQQSGKRDQNSPLTGHTLSYRHTRRAGGVPPGPLPETHYNAKQ